MARRSKRAPSRDRLFPSAVPEENEPQSSLLDVVDNVLNRGAVLNGDVVLGVANVDLIYLKLSVLLAAIDKIATHDPAFKPIAARPKRRASRRRSKQVRARRHRGSGPIR